MSLLCIPPPSIINQHCHRFAFSVPRFLCGEKKCHQRLVIHERREAGDGFIITVSILKIPFLSVVSVSSVVKKTDPDCVLCHHFLSSCSPWLRGGKTRTSCNIRLSGRGRPSYRSGLCSPFSVSFVVKKILLGMEFY